MKRMNGVGVMRYISPASYIIYIDGTTIMAVNGITCFVDFSGTDASIVIQRVHDVLAEGDTIILKPGTYIINQKLSITKSINFIGSGMSTILQAKNGLNDNIIEAYSGGYINDNRHYHTRGRFANFKISGNKANQDSGNGIVLAWTQFYMLENLYIYNVKDYGIKILRSYWTSLKDINCDTCNNGIKIGEYTSGLYNNGEGGDLFSNLNTFIDVRAATVTTGMLIESGENNTFIGCDTSRCITGILLQPHASGGNVSRNTFINHWNESNITGFKFVDSGSKLAMNTIVINPYFYDTNINIDRTGSIGLLKVHDATYDYFGSFGLPVVTKTNISDPYYITDNDYTILCDATNGGFTIKPPTAAGKKGRIYVIKKIDSTGNTITIDPIKTETIDGALTKYLITQYATITIQSDGANWIILSTG